jgi:RNA polymerase sigma factor (sigma-70 family)
MMTINRMTGLSTLDDLELVERSRSGDRDAFGELVARYQSLVCSITYSATGSLTTSEDLAQETFVAAWKQLGSLREPAKLRSWLCGIARNLSHNLVRRNVREPVSQSASLDVVAEQAAPEPLPAEQAVTREEEELLWRAVERIPETYREPLILYYRERQSVESVARALELSEDATKQRLSRGRKLLESELASFVEGALKRSAPGRAFTIGVLASLPAFAMSASAATVGASTVKGSAAAGSASVLMFLNAIMGPVIGILGAYIGVKASIEGTRTPRERAFMVRQAKRVIVATVLFNLAIFGFIFFAMPRLRENPWVYGVIGAAIPIAFTIFLVASTLRFSRGFMALRDEEQRLHPAAYSEAERVGAVREYRSKASFLGLPLFHFRSGRLAGEPHRPAVGWVAIGDRAYGILFAGGAVAVGGIAMGGISAGVLSIGGATLGVFALGGLAIGGLALGGAAIGAIAMGGVAVAYVAAEGGLAIAQQFAFGGAAFAQHANDAAARQFFAQWKWLDITRPEVRNVLTLIGWLPLLLIFVGARKARKKG